MIGQLTKPLLAGSVCAVLLLARAAGQAPDLVLDLLKNSQLDLSTDGKRFLTEAGTRASLFALGGLHGDNETQTLVAGLWPSLEAAGYRYICYREVTPAKTP